MHSMQTRTNRKEYTQNGLKTIQEDTFERV